MSESTIKPNKLTLRKLDSDHAYVYVRTNAKVVEHVGMDGEIQSMWEYDEKQIRVPVPSLGLKLPSPDEHAFDQRELKDEAHKAGVLGKLSGEQEQVDREENVRPVEKEVVLKVKE